MRYAISTLLALATTTLFTGEAQAEHRYDRAMHRFADSMEHTADELYREVKIHYTHRRDFHRLRSVARIVEEKTDHIKHVVDRHGSPRHIRADLEEIDRCMHELQEMLAHSDYRAHRHGEPHHVRRHVRAEMHELENTVHAMRRFMDHVAAKPVHHVRPVYEPVRRHAPVVVRRDHGLSFGGRWGRVHFRF